MKTRLLGFAAALAFLNAASPASAAVNLISNGSFEFGSFSNAPFDTLGAGSSAMTDWTISSGSIDWIGSYWQSSDGVRNVDLSGNGLGSISQSFSTVAGQQYSVSFDLSGNFDGPPTTKQVVVEVNGSPLVFTYTLGGNSPGNMLWQSSAFTFIADGTSEVLKFTSSLCGDGGACSYGAALDNVAVSAVPELSTWAMMLLGFAGIGFLTYRKSQKMKLASA